VPRSTYKRIFLNRTASRRIENFDQIRSILEKYEFQIVDDDDERIIEYCKWAEIIVWIHGGAMTNILFSDPGTRVLELFPSDFIHNHYFNTSMTSGLRYDCLVCESTSAILSRTSNLIVDLNLFLESLNKIVHY
jgi:capsular polysaccharide biosynthesis protein